MTTLKVLGPLDHGLVTAGFRKDVPLRWKEHHDQLCLKKDACFEVFNNCKLHSVVFFKDWRNNGKKDEELDRGSPYFSYLMFFMNTVSHSWLSSLSYTILIFVRLPEEIVSLVYFVFQKFEFMLYSWPCGTQCFEVSRSNLVYEPRMRFAVVSV